MDKVILDMQGISKEFPGVIALNKVNLQLYEGEVHAVIGENGAGKSTLMKILIGLYEPDEGVITYQGNTVKFKSPMEVLNSGISMIHQEMSLVPTITVSENIWLGQEDKFMKFGLIDVKKRDKATEELLKGWGLNIKPYDKVSALSIAEMQLVEIARALSYKPRIMIMDEPTSALTDTEIHQLFKIIRRLSNENVTIVFISHKLDEIFEICDRISVYRDGHYIKTGNCSDISMDNLISMIAGREISEMFPKFEAKITDTVLRVKDFNSTGVFENINFELHKGEILGFCGLMGAGRTEIMRALFGIDNYTSGEVLIEGKKVFIKNPGDGVKNGIGMVTEDRLRMGSIHKISVLANTTIAQFHKICNRLGLYRPKNEISEFNSISGKLAVKYSSPKDPMGQLSGGNQQKVIIGRWLLTKPKILILDEPTRGIDVGSKSEIHRLISTLATEGMAIILISSELPEILGMSDRIIVIREGRMVFQCDRKDATQELLMSYAFGAKKV